MPTYRDLFELNIKYMDYLIAKTSLSHGYLKNIQVTGAEIEYEVRDLLRNLLPRRFHVTHGYIVSAKNTDDEPNTLMDMSRRERLISEEIMLRLYEDDGNSRARSYDDEEWIEKITILQENVYLW